MIGVEGVRRLSPADGEVLQLRVMGASEVGYTPDELLIEGPLWTRQVVVELIRLVVGVDMAEQGVGLWLRRHGFSPRRPARRVYEQQPAAVRAWLDG